MCFVTKYLMAGRGKNPNKNPNKAKCICPICDEAILEAVGKKPGQEAIECEGLHRGCAGLSKVAFEAVSKSCDPFYCPQCRLEKQQLELISLRDTVATLSSKLDALCNSDALASKCECTNSCADSSAGSQSAPILSYAQAVSGEVKPPMPSDHPRGNLILFYLVWMKHRQKLQG